MSKDYKVGLICAVVAVTIFVAYAATGAMKVENFPPHPWTDRPLP